MFFSSTHKPIRRYIVAYVVTPGEKYSALILGQKNPVANPGMTKKGFADVEARRPLLPKKPCEVVCGTGLRHMNVAEALRLHPTRYTATVGGATSMEVISGEKTIILPDGTFISPQEYTTLEDNAVALRSLIVRLPDDAVIYGGRPALIILGCKEAKSAAVYLVGVSVYDKILITEVVSTGEAESGMV